jgi:hypothetical protein
LPGSLRIPFSGFLQEPTPDYGIQPEVQYEFARGEPSPCAAVIGEWPTIGIEDAEFKPAVSDLILIHGPACDFDAKVRGLHGRLLSSGYLPL